MFICDIATVGATTHYFHVVLHLGLAGIVTLGGSVFLTLGVLAHWRARRATTLLAEAVPSVAAEGLRRA